MGIYDHEIKRVCEACPRLVIKAINSIFSKQHNEDAEVTYLNREQLDEEDSNSSFMDMLIKVEGSKYHWEFQLLEDNMAIRMYEYAIKETIKQIDNDSNQKDADKYELEIFMPEQAVIFLGGANKNDYINVTMHLPDKQIVKYKLSCISASQAIDELIEKGLFILIPFQEVQLNSRMNTIGTASEETQIKMAHTLYDYHVEVKNKLEKLTEDDILKTEELERLLITFSNLEKYLSEKNSIVRKEFDSMGDNDYIPWSDRVEARGIKIGEERGVKIGEARGEARGVERGKIEGRIEGLHIAGFDNKKIAETLNIPIEKVEEILTTLL